MSIPKQARKYFSIPWLHPPSPPVSTETLRYRQRLLQARKWFILKSRDTKMTNMPNKDKQSKQPKNNSRTEVNVRFKLFHSLTLSAKVIYQKLPRGK